MGRRSDSDEDLKKKKKSKHKSRSRSSSIESRSSKHKKSKKKHKHKSRSKSPDRSRSRRKSRSTSRDKCVIPKSYRYKSPSPYRSKRKSRSRSRTRKHSRSRSRSRSKRSRSRSRSRRSRSTSRSRGRRSKSPRKSHRSRSPKRRSRSPRRWSRSRSREKSKRDRSRSKERFDAWDKLKMAAAAKAEQKVESEDPCASIPGFDEMSLSEQSEARLQMALKAAAAAGEKLKEQGVLSKSLTTNFEEQQQRAWTIDSIENDSFTPAAFKASRTQAHVSSGITHEDAIFGLSDLTVNTTTPDSELRTQELKAKDTEALMHPNLYISSEDKMNNWIQKLTRMRNRKLEGSAMH